MDFKIKIDTREQIPYWFSMPTERGTLSVGDYSVVGFENQIAIERKALNDLIGCLTVGRDRFKKELSRAKTLDYFAVVVEGKFSDLTCGRYRSKMNPKAAVQSLLTFSVRYGRLPIFFCETRQYAQEVTESLLTKYVREFEQGEKYEDMVGKQ
ncbi:conserved hypothetical protein [uncultured Desulfobacterium sp.]|uniref:ERCC4 domain-containing protein n=1 Tax=uncultured Desulfobacterium sp. TaxID=201089 RepID=A0A445MWE0_9BACT|nr:conserved hypothetical protein [uncultured Desulfobacterium sp.]